MRKYRFAIGLAVYGLVLLLVIIAGLTLFWQYIAAYELSQVDGAMSDYLDHGLYENIDREIDRFAAAHETAFESAGRIAETLRAAVAGGELTCRKAREYTPDGPVYSIRLDQEELGRVYFRSYAGNALDFGFPRWFVHRAEFDFDRFARDYTVLAPSEALVALDGVVMTAANCSVAWEGPEELLPYSDQLVRMPLYARYAFSAFAPVEVSLPGGGEGHRLSQEENAFTVTPVCPPELSDQLYRYAEDFVRAYIAFTGNFTGPEAVTAYMVPGSILYQRMYGALAGLSWVSGVTGYLSELRVDSLRYYGGAATLEAHYRLTLDRMDTDNNMKIVLTQTEQGWRVAEIELF